MLSPNSNHPLCLYRQKVEEELDRLVAAPIVPVIKSDKKSVWICGDFPLTVNLVSRLNHYPIPKIEDPFVTLKNGKIGLRQAYQQLTLDKLRITSDQHVCDKHAQGDICRLPGLLSTLMTSSFQTPLKKNI